MTKNNKSISVFQLPFIFIFWSVTTTVLAQPAIQWQKCYGGSRMDVAYSTKQTNDGGYITIGDSKSNNFDVSGHHGLTLDSIDVWVVKTTSVGILQWQKSFGGTSWDWGSDIVQTSDGGYILTGTTNSFDGDVTGNHGNSDAWVVKLDVSGNIQWKKCLGGTNADIGRTIKQMPDGGYIVGATAMSNNGDVSGNHGGYDLWMVKLNSIGVIQWQKCYGGTVHDGSFGMGLQGNNFQGVSVTLTSDGGFFVGTSACSNDGDLTAHFGNTSFNNTDYWALKIDSIGALQWQKSLGGTNTDKGLSGLETSGGYIITGASISNDGDFAGANGNYDIWIVKLNSSGSVTWKKNYGGTNLDQACSIEATNDGGYFISGFTQSTNGTVVGNHGAKDSWVLKLDANGNLQWQKCLGGTSQEQATSGFQTNDDGYIVSGWAGSNNSDVTGNHSSVSPPYDFWLVKLYPVPEHVICGNIYGDLNINCIKDNSESGLVNRVVKATPGNYFAVTDSSGNYTLFVDTGSYVVSHIPPQYYNQSCPVASGVYNININSVTPNSYGNNFADTLTSHCADLRVSIGTPFLRRCFRNIYAVSYSNVGVLTVSNVTIGITFDADIIPISSTLPWTVAGNQYVFNAGTLQSGQGGVFYITDSVSCAAALYSVNGVTAQITTHTAECTVADNTISDYNTIVGSCDPNSKMVQSQIPAGGYVVQENIVATDALTYLIRFQNTGNDTAFTVVVRDTLSNFLDPSSVILDAASHPYSFRIYGQGICEWTFSNILLPDSTTNETRSHGFIKFHVKQIAGNLPGTTIYNGGSIWFDYNAPFETNVTDNSIPIITGAQQRDVLNKHAIVYPNPFGSETTITVSEDLHNAELVVYDVLGKELQRLKNISSHSMNVQRKNLTGGLYFYNIIQDHKIIYKGKFIAE